MGDIAQRKNNTSDCSKLPNVSYEDISANIGTLNKSVNKLSTGKKGILFKKDDVLFGKLRPYLNNYLFADFTGIAIGDFWVLNHKEAPQFLFYLIQSPKFRYISNISSGSKMPRSDWNLVSNYKFNVPATFEQTSIGKTLKLIDTLITLQQRKLEQLKLLKKAMLQKCFTKKSAPTLRFKGFSKAWTEYPLGNLGKARSGYGFPNSEQGGNKGIPFYKVSDMNLSGNEDEMIYANNYVTDAQIDRNNWKPIVDVPAIFFAKVGAAVLLNRKRLCKRPFLLDNNTMAYSLNKNILSTQFTKSLFETINLPSFIQVGALPSYNTNDIESIKVKIPKIDEQEKIGILLKKIERLITRQQSKIKKLQSTKQFLLQNMFI